MMLTWAQCRRAVLLPFSFGGRNFIRRQIVLRGEPVVRLLARLYRRTLARRIRVTMVVGTYGKTTTTRAVSAALGLPPDRWLEFNPNCFGHIAWALLRQPPWRKHVAVEAGIGGPDTMRGYVQTLRPQAVVVTCIGSEHRQAFRDLEHLRDEKAEAVRALPADGVAVLNADDPNVMWMASQTRARVVRYGFAADADVRGKAWQQDGTEGTTLALEAGGAEFVLRSQLVGAPAVSVMLAAVAAAQAEGVPPRIAVERLERLTPTPGRLEAARLPNGARVLCDDYKNSIETAHAALDALAAADARRRVIVLGGLDSPPKPQRPAYRDVAAHASRVADWVIAVGHSSELYAPELHRCMQGAAALARFDHVTHVSEATDLLRGALGEGDVLLIKGQRMQHLRRVMLALQGRKVGCAVDGCRLHLQFCDDCAFLEKRGPVGGIRVDERLLATALTPIAHEDQEGDGAPP